MLIALTLLTVFAPGIWFPAMAQPLRKKDDVEKRENPATASDPTPSGSNHERTDVGKSEA
jgi:hypothetical protein